MKQRKTAFSGRAFLILTIALLLFIWGQSLLPVKNSAAESGWLRETILNPLLAIFGLGPLSDHFVRKAAHITEFFFFGLSAAFLWRGRFALTLLTAFVTAFLDETIQIFSGRGSRIKDVWIDLIGAAAGSFLGWLIFKLKNKKEQKK